MLENLIWLVIGMLVGWNFLPQPKWVADLWAQIFGK